MSVRDFPPRPQGAQPDSVPYQNWLDALGQRQNIDLLQELTSVASGDELPIFDVSETGQNKTKKVTVANLAAAIGGGISWQTVKTSDFTAVSGEGYPIDTTSTSVEATLPASPSVGDSIAFVDYAGTWQSSTVLLKLNGNKFYGSAADRVLNQKNEGIVIVYTGSTQGWLPYSAINFTVPSTFSVEYLVIGGGGGGGNRRSGGGGAGGYKTSTVTVAPNTTYTVTVGGGGAGGTGGFSGNIGTSGSDSAFWTITSAGGGGGGGLGSRNGSDGGSGGGASFDGTAGTGNTPSASPSQGNNGGTGQSAANPNNGGGGGGGAGGAGGNMAAGNTGGTGGSGASSSITGSAVTRAWGGVGGGFDNMGTAASGSQGNGNGASAGSNTGGGGNGTTEAGGSAAGGSGGSGVVILKYPDTLTISNPGGGLTLSTAGPSGGFKVTTITAGTGNVSWS